MCRSRHAPACFFCGRYGDKAKWDDRLLVWQISDKLQPLQIEGYNSDKNDGFRNRDDHIYACGECIESNGEDVKAVSSLDDSDFKLARHVYIQQNNLNNSNRSSIPKERMGWEQVRYLKWEEEPKEMYRKQLNQLDSTYIKCKISLLSETMWDSENFKEHSQTFVIEKGANGNFKKHIVVATIEDINKENQETAFIGLCQICFENEDRSGIGNIQIENSSIQTKNEKLDGIFITSVWVHSLVNFTNIRAYMCKFIEWVCPDDLVRLSVSFDNKYKESFAAHFKERTFTTEYNKSDNPTDAIHVMKPVRKNLKDFIL